MSIILTIFSKEFATYCVRREMKSKSINSIYTFEDVMTILTYSSTEVLSGISANSSSFSTGTSNLIEVIGNLLL